MPLSSDELDPKDDVRTRFDVRSVPKRLASLKDPWADYWGTRQAITAKTKQQLAL